MKVDDAMVRKAAYAYLPTPVPSDVHLRYMRAALEAVLTDVPEELGEVCDGEHEGPCPAWHDGVGGLRQRIDEKHARIAELEMELQTRPAASEGLTELVRRLTHAQQKLERIRMWRNSDDGKYALPQITELDAILEEP